MVGIGEAASSTASTAVVIRCSKAAGGIWPRALWRRRRLSTVSIQELTAWIASAWVAKSWPVVPGVQGRPEALHLGVVPAHPGAPDPVRDGMRHLVRQRRDRPPRARADPRDPVRPHDPRDHLAGDDLATLTHVRAGPRRAAQVRAGPRGTVHPLGTSVELVDLDPQPLAALLATRWPGLLPGHPLAAPRPRHSQQPTHPHDADVGLLHLDQLTRPPWLCDAFSEAKKTAALLQPHAGTPGYTSSPWHPRGHPLPPGSPR